MFPYNSTSNKRGYDFYFYNNEDLFLIKKYFNFVERITDKLPWDNTFFVNILLFLILIIHLVPVGIIFYVFNIDYNFLGVIFPAFIYLYIYKDSKYQKQSKLLFGDLNMAYPNEIEIYLFILDDLKYEYKNGIREIDLVKTKNIDEYLIFIMEKFNLRDLFHSMRIIHRLHFNTRYGYPNLYRGTNDIDPFFILTRGYNSMRRIKS